MVTRLIKGSLSVGTFIYFYFNKRNLDRNNLYKMSNTFLYRPVASPFEFGVWSIT